MSAAARQAAHSRPEPRGLRLRRVLARHERTLYALLGALYCGLVLLALLFIVACLAGARP